MPHNHVVALVYKTEECDFKVNYISYNYVEEQNATACRTVHVAKCWGTCLQGKLAFYEASLLLLHILFVLVLCAPLG